MAITRIGDLLDVDVFAESIATDLGGKIRLYPYAFVQNFQNTQVGTVNVNEYNYIGDSVVLPEATALTPALLSSTQVALPIVKQAQSIQLSDESLRGAFGSPIQEANNQLTESIARGIESEMMASLAGATLTYTTPAGGEINTDTVLFATELFGENYDMEGKALVINPANLGSVRTDGNYDSEGNQLLDLDVVVSSRVPLGSAYILAPNALGLYYSRDILVETDRSIIDFTTVISASCMYAQHLRNDSRIVRIAITA